jgi:hypothetical protein
MEHGGEADIATDVEGSNALGGVDLVAGYGEEVDILEKAACADVEREFAGGLDGVGVEESSSGVGDSGEGVNGLYYSGLVVGVHDADETGVGLDSGEERGGLDEALRRDGKEGNFDSARSKGFGGVEDRVVLDCGGDEVVAWGEDAEDGKVVALGAAGGEDNFRWAAVKEAGDGLASVVDCSAGMLALLVDRAGVAVVLQVIGTHRLEDFG